MFIAKWFAIAGLIAAAGPVLIHLLNRQRFKVVEWGAMDFLREAVFRSRRIVRLRDLLLLALRMFCIMAFGAALARPFFGSFFGALGSGGPVHAVLLIDNSLSMGYVLERESRDGQPYDRTLLDEAKLRAEEVIDEVPPGSRISVLPTCGPAGSYSHDAYYSKEDAREAVAAIRPVDQAALPDETIDRALAACDGVRDPGEKRIVLVTDRQVADWPVPSLADHLQRLPAPVDVVQVQPEGPVDNAWISDFRVQDGVADLRNPATFLATIHYEGPQKKRDVIVTLSINGQTVEGRKIDLQSGSDTGREVRFEPYPFQAAGSAALGSPDESQGNIAFATAKVSISAEQGDRFDGLAADDERFLVVPLVATLPVVFVDPLGDRENPALNLFGETVPLRRLLAPKTGRIERERQFVEVRHARIEQVDRSLLEDARLVVIAGVKGPDAATVELLRAYVEQGGNLVIAAGADFDPDLWNQAAWRSGLGILPAPLAPQPVGRPLDSLVQGPEFRLDYESLKNHDYFLLEGSSEEDMEEMYRLPIFSMAVEAIDSDRWKEEMAHTTEEYLRKRQSEVEQIDRRLAELRELEEKRQLTADDRDERASLEGRRQELRPSWLLFSDPAESEEDQRPTKELAEETKFLVLGRYTNGLPFMIERRIGRGRVLMVTTGVFPRWNLLSRLPAVVIYDRIFRDMIQDTLPKRNVDCQRGYVLPVSAAARTARIKLSGPDQPEELLSVDAIGAHRYGVTIGAVTRRGVYRVTAERSEDSLAEGLDTRLWSFPLAFNGPADESRLLSREEIQRRRQRGQADAVAEAAGVFSLGNFKAARLRGAKTWRWLAAGVLAALLLELVILARAGRGTRDEG
ncbi:MAG TPA: BatA domain-containing protein [Thermoguttaceae bacterium]|nr:BatA domain-containing protein [Thermoguttaceae bacterium]